MHKLTKSVVLLAGFFLAALCVHAQGAQLTVRWDDNSTNEAGFKIERAPGAASLGAALVFSEVGSVAPNVTTFVDTSAVLLVDKEYSYRVRAFTSSGYSPFSNISSAKTAPGLPNGTPGGTVVIPPAAVVTLNLEKGEQMTFIASSVPVKPRNNGPSVNLKPGEAVKVAAVN